MAALNRAKILCVDDEVRVVEGLQLTLGRRFDVRTATSGADGLELLRREPDVVVIISDMRMPQMDGTSFLAKAKELVPDATRMLLTGQADLDSAIAVVWSSGTGGHPGAKLVLQNDGNAVIYDGATPLWATHTCCH